VPEKTAPVATVTKGCSATFQWVEPVNGGAEITGYDLQVKNADGEFKSFEECSKAPVYLKCEISMEVLRSAPYELRKGNAILARVRAKNNKGWSEYSEFDLSGKVQAFILDKPFVLPTPKYEDISRTDIRVYWETLDNAEEYSVHKEIDGVFTEITRTTDNFYLY